MTEEVEIKEVPGLAHSPEIEKQISQLDSFKHNMDLLTEVVESKKIGEALRDASTVSEREALLLNNMMIVLNDVSMGAIQKVQEIISDSHHMIYIHAFSSLPKNKTDKRITNFDYLQTLDKSNLKLKIQNEHQGYLMEYSVKLNRAERDISAENTLSSETFVFEVL